MIAAIALAELRGEPRVSVATRTTRELLRVPGLRLEAW